MRKKFEVMKYVTYKQILKILLDICLIIETQINI